MLKRPLQLFIAYSREDRTHLEALITHLTPLRRESLIEVWHDGDIQPGEDWDEAIGAKLSSAHVIMALVSASFVASYRCYDLELAKALKRHDAKAAVLIPVIVRHCLWQELPIGRIQALPTNAKPLEEWTTEDDFWTDIVTRLRQLCIRRLAETEAPSEIEPRVQATKEVRRRGRALWIGGAGLGLASLAAGTLHFGTSSARCPAGTVHIAGGTFRMGSEDYDREAAGDERPPHEVALNDFCLDIDEVTVERYRQCTREVRNGISCPPAPSLRQWDKADLKFRANFCNGDRSDRDNHPINCVDWKTADIYCKWAGGALPTEAQWEYAARGVERRRFPWGNEPPEPRVLNACGGECRAMAAKLGKTLPAMFEGDDGAEATAPVGSYPNGATPEGVLDLAGNVAEWVRDTKANYAPGLSKDPVQTAGTLHVLRGGGWYSSTPRAVRAAARDSLEDGYFLNGVGFRCVREREK